MDIAFIILYVEYAMMGNFNVV